MLSYHYTTVFYANEPYYVFTKSSRSKQILGCIPAGWSFTYRGRTYETAQVLTAICARWKEGRMDIVRDAIGSYKKPVDWQAKTKRDFVRVCKLLMA